MTKTKFGVGDRFLAILLASLAAFKFLPFAYFLAFFVVIISIAILYIRHEKQHWQRHGIPSPPGSLLFGHMFEMHRKNGIAGFDKENYSKYGKTLGIYLFDRKQLCTVDMELLKRIFIKDFSHFQNRFNMNKERTKQSLLRNVISIIRDDDWRRVRNRVTPAFTTGKLKRLIPTLCESTNRMCEYIERKFIPDNKEIPLKDLFGRLVLEEIGRAGFSYNFDTFADGEENIFVQKTRDVFKNRRNIYLLTFLSFCPFLIDIMERYFRFEGFNLSHKFFHDLMSDLYEKRKADPEAKNKYNDIFQLLMNAVDEENETTGNGEVQVQAEDADFVHKEIWANVQKNKHLTKIELFAQSFILLIAGYDTTGSVLHFVMYMLAMKPEIQEKVREEVLEVLEDEDETISYEHQKRMIYLQAVVLETLRMYPPAPAMNRECNKDICLDGVPLSKGDLVELPIYHIQNSEEFYQDPGKFMPERFLTADGKLWRDPLTFLAFGIGPRNCIGMRFAEFQMHIAVATLVRRFTFKPGPNTPKLPLKLDTTSLLRPFETLVVLAEKN